MQLGYIFFLTPTVIIIKILFVKNNDKNNETTKSTLNMHGVISDSNYYDVDVSNDIYIGRKVVYTQSFIYLFILNYYILYNFLNIKIISYILYYIIIIKTVDNWWIKARIGSGNSKSKNKSSSSNNDIVDSYLFSKSKVNLTLNTIN